MKKFPTIIIVAIVVAIIAFNMLEADSAELVLRDRTLISAGAGVLSGTIMWILLTLDKKDKK
ncbi:MULTISPECIES: hypothetical protein [Cytobacillus]|uniref:Uncharacterized protein n=1 Tax=Cytobacillus kochii TaxID=859143 RepID=A0A248TEN0_9BACI|nr:MULTISPECIES: hypothetical protein [Cytobacillus]ASV66582.1 hypothetical protein CKF48_04145 [Cytobacillus kochii]MCA1024894.1 hypothetical protein [Cytobacillus kochii]MCM3323623.1 hypothetical protein [Cytobacillus kochii]MCM3346196.1 hypothetical protein [Cytobacillus kochii]MDM5206586.1 hypothetical protein [Cytobacillus kochii]